MKQLTSILSLSLLTMAAGNAQPEQETSSPAQGADMIRFANHDTLHGTFLSFGSANSLNWQSPETKDPIPFSTKKLHRVVLNRGQAHQALQYKSAVHLANGDVIPGEIISSDQKKVVLNTEHLGQLSISREHVSRLAPNPFGGKLLYFGPLNADGWESLPISQPKGKADDENKEAGEDKPSPDKNKDEAKDESEEPSDWKFVANAWYSGTDKSTYLVRKDALQDQCKISFKMAWRNSLYASVILHADFAPPEYEGEEKLHSSTNNSAGHAYILGFTNHSATLTSTTFDKDGKPQTNRFDNTRASLRLSGKNESNIEIRLDRTNQSILLFADGSFRGKWELGESYDGKGNHLAFRNLRYNNADLRVSDIAISHWNGMKDSAQSMTTAERDVILLNNGVDRFSGAFKNLQNGQVTFTGSFDNDMSIPVEDIQEIHFATNHQKGAQDPPKGAVYFFVYPYGRITGTPSASSNGKTKLLTDLLGEVNLDTRYINIIDFTHTNSLLDFWDDNF